VKKKTVYQTDVDGLFMYETEANELALDPGRFNVPYGATETPPPPVAVGSVARWTGTAWEEVEDHRGETLYRVETGEPYEPRSLVEIDGEDVTYPGWGELPGWLTASAPVEE
jgi:hypothetical protein